MATIDSHVFFSKFEAIQNAMGMKMGRWVGGTTGREAGNASTVLLAQLAEGSRNQSCNSEPGPVNDTDL